jgi:dTDP-4-dehydrorhamnose 3,5-epimerase
MKIEGLEISGTFEVFTTTFQDSRGSFEKIYSDELYDKAGLAFRVKQSNLSRNTLKATVRGMHFQSSPLEECKIVTCVSGEIFDVMVDLRQSSKTFGLWQSVILKPSLNAVYIPAGVAHGFQTLSHNSIIQYLHSENYNQSLTAGVKYDDPDIGVKWPLNVSEISKSDLSLPSLAELRSIL